MWLHYIRENMLTRIVDLFYISTQDQIADIFTKVLEKNKFTNLRNEMGIKKSEFMICIPVGRNRSCTWSSENLDPQHKTQCFLYCTKLLVNITPKSRYLPLTIQPSTVYLRTTLMSNSVETWAITIIHQGNRLLRQLPSASPSPIGIRIHEWQISRHQPKKQWRPNNKNQKPSKNIWSYIHETSVPHQMKLSTHHSHHSKEPRKKKIHSPPRISEYQVNVNHQRALDHDGHTSLRTKSKHIPHQNPTHRKL